MLKFQIEEGTTRVRKDQIMAVKCYITALKGIAPSIARMGFVEEVLLQEQSCRVVKIRSEP